MAELSPLDAELLAQELPALAQVAVESSIYSGRQGQIEYRAAGDATNPAVLMLHGLGSSSAGYRAQFAGLSRDFHVVAWNAPGFGASSPIPGQDAGVDDYANALEGLLRSLGIRRLAVLVGSSWGSVVALAFARRYPALTGSLVLSAPTPAKVTSLGKPAMPNGMRGFARRISASRFRALRLRTGCSRQTHRRLSGSMSSACAMG
jgi:pimeloyl-ACP methyl ester carboxylesterase